MPSQRRGIVRPAGRFIATWTGAVCLGFALLQLAAGAAQAQVVTEFSAGISAGAEPGAITAGPDGNLWFTERRGLRIGRITPNGVVTEFSAGITGGSRPSDITVGPDGNLWFTVYPGGGETGRIGRITPSGVVTEFREGIGTRASPTFITAGADGNLWFTEYFSEQIGRITPNGVITEFGTGIAGDVLGGIASGPDGNLWFTEILGNRIGRITPSGVVTEFSAGITARANLGSITTGPDGNLWFTEVFGNRIGRITPNGVVTEFSAGITAGSDPNDITAGPDGNLWFTEWFGNRIGRITPNGVVTEFSAGISAGASLGEITAGPDGNLWFTEILGNRIGRITPPALVVEYHHASFDHYFITPVSAEIALLDARVPPFQEWSRTGFSFDAYANVTAPAGSVPICRFFNNHFAPKSSHFYAAHGFGCEATLAQFPDWGLEDDKLFNMMLPDATTGVCPTGTIPLYRLYNNGMGNAPNHRFVTSVTERQNMLNLGWVAEGAGFGVGMCAPK
jgi:streptogramin lyase